MTNHILRIDSSARTTGSISRDLSDHLIQRLSTADTTVTTRDLAEGIPQINQDWLVARGIMAADQTPEQSALMALSETLIAELQAADTIVIGLSIYNFSVPAALKAWIDQVARPGLTFSYSPDGPKGLLTDKKVYVAYASGGTKNGSEIDFASNYLRFFLGFIGITDVTFVAADQTAIDLEGSVKSAHDAIEALPVAA